MVKRNSEHGFELARNSPIRQNENEPIVDLGAWIVITIKVQTKARLRFFSTTVAKAMKQQKGSKIYRLNLKWLILKLILSHISPLKLSA